MEVGVIIEHENGTFEINPYVRPLLERERAHAVVTRVVRASDEIGYKPIFNSKQEYQIYDILVSLFPNCLVFPNMGLQAIFQYEWLKEQVDSEQFRYYLMASVDFCIVSTTTYLPIVGVEVDSRFHDLADQQERDAKKDIIFQLAVSG